MMTRRCAAACPGFPHAAWAAALAAGPSCLIRRAMSQSQRLDSQYQKPTQNPNVAMMFLMVGLPGAGKTTRAEELAAVHRALRLTPDHWMIPLFGDSMAEG